MTRTGKQFQMSNRTLAAYQYAKNQGYSSVAQAMAAIGHLEFNKAVTDYMQLNAL